MQDIKFVISAVVNWFVMTEDDVSGASTMYKLRILKELFEQIRWCGTYVRFFLLQFIELILLFKDSL